jgi:excisionase family DNA binding protein
VGDHLIDANAAGELLGVPHTWVLREARADRIPHVRLGRYVRFDAGQLEEWWRNRQRGPVLCITRPDNAGPATLERPGP